MSHALESLLDEIRRLEPLPSISLEVLELAGREDTRPAQLCRLIETDPALCARVLQLANSPLYGFIREIASLDEACNLLGTRCLASLVLTSAVARNYSGGDDSERERRQRAWERAIRNAVAARLLATLTGLADRHRAYTAALLCDIGELVMLQHFPAEHAGLETLPAEQRAQGEQRVFGITHAQAGAILLERWRLPDALAECARWHHDPAQARIDPLLTRLVHLASSLAEHFEGPDTDIRALLEGTGIGESALDSLQDELARELTRARGLQALIRS